MCSSNPACCRHMLTCIFMVSCPCPPHHRQEGFCLSGVWLLNIHLCVPAFLPGWFSPHPGATKQQASFISFSTSYARYVPAETGGLPRPVLWEGTSPCHVPFPACHPPPPPPFPFDRSRASFPRFPLPQHLPMPAFPTLGTPAFFCYQFLTF